MHNKPAHGGQHSDMVSPAIMTDCQDDLVIESVDVGIDLSEFYKSAG